MDNLDKFVYRWRERIERMKEADSFSVELFAIDVRSNGDECDVCISGICDVW